MQEKKQARGKELYEWVQALVGSVLLVVLVFAFVVRLIGVDGSSMEPTLKHGDRLLVLNGSHLAMDGTPAEVFARAEELVQMGLNIPQVTRVFLELQKLGLDVEPVYTLQQAIEILTSIKGGTASC